MYGESVFTTMRMVNGVIQDWEHHFDRLSKGVEFVFGPFTEGDDWSSLLKNRIQSKLIDFDGNKVIRVTIYREQARGLRLSSIVSETDLRLHFNHSPLEINPTQERMLKLRSCPAPDRPSWWPSYLKAGNYLESIITMKLFLRETDDDVLFVSRDNIVHESSIANIFVVLNNTLLTSPVGPNVLDGVMRKKVMTLAGEFFQEIRVAPFTLNELYQAQAVFGTNSVKGLFLVDRIDDYEITYNDEFLDMYKRLKDKALL
jgi:4-amino-4-deoxychorismate lyase